ncbi:DUF1622 domain-containing protein [Ekhidna sp.]|uniref:DUF1622 domain-containing protein n=1 Tax=Ekhidna sp. TaxID=2608089 RepID=UPI003B507C19
MNNLEHFVEIVATVIGYVGISFIVLGVILAIGQYLISRFANKYTIDHVRLTLGTYILIGLEFMVGQDIIETVLHTTLEQLYMLGLIVIIRTLLDFFLSREMTQLKQHIAQHEAAYLAKKTDP